MLQLEKLYADIFIFVLFISFDKIRLFAFSFFCVVPVKKEQLDVCVCLCGSA